MPYKNIKKRREAQKRRYYAKVKKQLQEDTERRRNYYEYMKKYKRKARESGLLKPSKSDIEKAKKWQKQNREKLNTLNRKYNDELRDCYVLDQLKKSTGISETELRKYPELIMAKRTHLLIKRQIKCKQKLNP